MPSGGSPAPVVRYNVVALNITFNRDRIRPSDLAGMCILQAFEPEVFGVDRMVLCTDGAIRIMTSDEIVQALPGEKK